MFPFICLLFSISITYDAVGATRMAYHPVPYKCIVLPIFMQEA